MASDWIELDSPDMWVRHDSELVRELVQNLQARDQEAIDVWRDKILHPRK
jgi:hypothetical protein